MTACLSVSWCGYVCHQVFVSVVVCVGMFISECVVMCASIFVSKYGCVCASIFVSLCVGMFVRELVCGCVQRVEQAYFYNCLL